MTAPAMRRVTGPVVVGVVGSALDAELAALAADEAAVRHTALVVLHARRGHTRSGRPVDEEDQGRARRRIAPAIAATARPDVRVTTELPPADPVDALLDRTSGACLAVVGHRGHCPGGRPGGSVALQIAGRTAVPVIVHRTGGGQEWRAGTATPVFAGVAGAADAAAVLPFAFAEAAIRGAPLVVVHACPGEGDRIGAERLLREACGSWRERFPDVLVRVLVRQGLDAAVALTVASRRSRLIVVGAGGHRRSEARCGDTVHALIHRAHCPVAVVPVPPAPAAG